MSDEPKVSVVMPVYNTASYLRQCLDSVINQTLRDIEIICVDDGSTDDSLAILEEYAAADLRIRILRQQNQYAGVARNNGMKIARGKYLAFWDSDDYFDHTALEKMHDQAEADQADICVCGASRIVDGLEEPVRESMYLRKKMLPDRVPFNIETNREYILNFTNAAPWNKLFRRAFVEERQIVFSEAQNAEDVYFVEVALCLAGSITTVDDSLVVYRRDRVGSLTNTITDSYLVPLGVWVETAKELRRRGVYPEVSFANRALGNIIYMLRNQKNFHSFNGIVDALKTGALKELSLTDDLEIRTEWHAECLRYLRDSTPEEVLMYLMNFTYRHMTEVELKARLAKSEVRRWKREVRLQKRRYDALSDRSIVIGEKAKRVVSGVRRRFRR